MDKDVAHNIVSDIKKVASELGRIPTRDEYLLQGIYSRHEIVKQFGLWTEAAKAAFGEIDKKTKDYISIEKTLDHYNSKAQSQLSVAEKLPILIIGDTHFPFVDVDALTWLYSQVEKYKPKIVLQCGDLHDCFAQTRFPRSYNCYSPQEEIDLAYRMASFMWKQIKEIVPNADCYQLHGNHTLRPIKSLLAGASNVEPYLELNKYMNFDGVHLVEDPREELYIGDTVFTHGWLSNLGAHRDYLMKSVVCGHSHLGGVSYKQVHGRTIFELNAGYFGNPMSKALSYTPTKTVKWTIGHGLIDEDGPRFISL